MKLTFEHPHKLSFLHDEILAAVPEVAPVDGQAVMLVQGDGETLMLTLPDDLPESAVAAITAVVEAHDPLMQIAQKPTVSKEEMEVQLVAQAEAIVALMEKVQAQQAEIDTLKGV